MLRVLFVLLFTIAASCVGQQLPFDTVFKGEAKFQTLVTKAAPLAKDLRSLPIGERVAWFGQSLVGTPYKGFTLEIDDRIEAPSVNLTGLDCWTFFESALAFARMAELEPDKWTPQQMLHLIEVDRYRGGRCDGSYLSRLHYLEDWSRDNDRRGYVNDLTSKLGGVRVANAAIEMTHNWKGYRYMVNSAANRSGITRMEDELRQRPLIMIPLSKVPDVEPKLQSGDIISIVSKDGAAFGTSHVGLALRKDGVLHFMHASSPRNFGKVVIDSRLSEYLTRYKTHAGIMVARPVK